MKNIIETDELTQYQIDKRKSILKNFSILRKMKKSLVEILENPNSSQEEKDIITGFQDYYSFEDILEDNGYGHVFSDEGVGNILENKKTYKDESGDLKVRDKVLSDYLIENKGFTKEGIEKIIEDKNKKNTEISNINKASLTSSLMMEGIILNKGKEEKLLNYIDKKILEKTIEGEDDLLTTLKFYLKYYSMISTQGGISKKLEEMISGNVFFDYKKYSKRDIAYELMYNNVLLPESENQEDFNKSLDILINGIEKKVEKASNKFPINIRELNPGSILMKMEETGNYVLEGKMDIPSGIISSISYDFDLSSISEGDNIPRVTFSLDFSKISGENGVEINEMLSYLRNSSNFSNIDDKTFLLFTTPDLGVYARVGELFIEPGLTDENTKEVFKIDFYTRDLYNKDIYEDKSIKDYFSASLDALPPTVMKFTEDIYETFGKYYKACLECEICKNNEEIEDEEDMGTCEKPVVVDYKVGKYQQVFDIMDDIDNQSEHENPQGKVIKGKALNGGKEGDKLDEDIIEKFSNMIVKQKEPVKLTDVGGQEKAKIEVKKIIKSIKYEEIMRSWGAKTTTGLIFEGGPGTGKTLLAKAIAGEVDADVYNIKLTDIASSAYINEGANNVKDLFKFLRYKAKETKNKIIVILEELDALFKKRNSNDSSEDTKIVNTFLTEMSGFDEADNIIFVGTTNRIDELDQAVIRSGRMSTKVKVDMPNLKDRQEIFEIHINKSKNKSEKVKEAFNGIEEAYLAEISEGLSGADIEEVIRQIIQEKALEEIDTGKTTKIEKEDYERVITIVKEQSKHKDKKVGFFK